MNLCDAWVKEIKAEPRLAYGRWWVDVKYICEGRLGETSIMCSTLEEAERVEVGYKFLV